MADHRVFLNHLEGSFSATMQTELMNLKKICYGENESLRNFLTETSSSMINETNIHWERACNKMWDMHLEKSYWKILYPIHSFHEIKK